VVSRGRVSQEVKEANTLVDLGCNVFAKAHMCAPRSRVVPLSTDFLSAVDQLPHRRSEDASKICVEVGLGFFAEFTLGEAEKFITSRLSSLQTYTSQRR
jgi:prefoldin subunit 5